MNNIAKKLHDNRQVELAKRILESRGYTVSSEENSPRQINEDWRSGEITREDIDRYINEQKSIARSLAFSFTHMLEKNPEYKEDLTDAIVWVRDLFGDLI